MKLSLEEIKALPLTTNKIKVAYDREKLFSEYSIVSYYSLDKEYKNLAYEQLCDIPFISVCGLRARWKDMLYSGIRFFILIRKDEATSILKSLRDYDKIKSRIDDLEDYDDVTKQRILASLAINSLGQMNPGKMMYNNGSLLLCDDKNFLVNKSRKELVCLKIEVNEFLNLTAKTTSFSTPRNEEHLRKNGSCVFQVSKDINGQWWSGLSVKPVVLRKVNLRGEKIEDFFIQKKRFSDKHNLVPYWPYNPEDYTHGRLFAISQVVESANNRFESLIHLEFTDYEVLFYDEYKSEKDMLAFLTDYLSGRNIFIEDPFNNASSQEFIKTMKQEFQLIMNDALFFPKKQQQDCLLIKLCEPQDEQIPQTHYLKSLYRMAYSGVALQHKIFYDDEREDTFSKSEARRILIELLVKDCLINRRLPEQLVNLIQDWKFYRYKIQEGFIIGASMVTEEGCTIRIEEYGFPSDKKLIDFNTFSKQELLFDDAEKIQGKRDYMALKRGNNVYLIIDTDEIPILDVALIDEGYGKIINNNTPLSLFKRKKVAHQYLRGYIGFHLWKSDGIDGEKESAYSYISGFNSENMQIMRSNKMDRMPRARKIFVLHCDNPSTLNDDIQDIENMLRFGFGRWNELMTYPFPFKFLQEYLDDACEVTFSKHWNEITYKLS